MANETASGKLPIALVTGASAGLGEVFARRLAARGHDLVLVARRRDRLEKLAAECKERHGVSALTLGVDLARPDGPAEVFRRVGEAKLDVGLLINNAGYGTLGPIAESDEAKELGQIDLNVRALVALTRLFLPGMLARRAGAIVQMGSVASFLPIPYMTTYAATKAFVLSFTEGLAAEIAGSGVHVMVVCPGGTRTEFQEVAKIEAGGFEGQFMDAERVVDLALRALDRRRRVCVTGWSNKVQARLVDWLPRGITARAAGAIFGRLAKGRKR